MMPRVSLPALFALFLRFGALAWGGPIAQLGMLRSELVDRRGWTTREHFARALAVYQVLPGPEAHEMCCWFGHLARGRVGAFIAGLGFMLPGVLLLWLAALLYESPAGRSPLALAAFAGAQPAVLALVARAVPRIAGATLRSRTAWLVAAAGAIGETLALPFWMPLLFGALWLPLEGRRVARALLLLAFVGATLALLVAHANVTATPSATIGAAAAPGSLLALGLRTGLLTFGGAYTAIPFVHDAAVVGHAWIPENTFVDALAIAGVLPTPLIAFTTFLGQIAGGHLGALAITFGVFLPAFAFTVIGHGAIERLVHARRAHAALDGVAAAVTGLIAVTAVRLCASAVDDWSRATIFGVALVAAATWQRPWLPVLLVAGGSLATVTGAWIRAA